MTDEQERRGVLNGFSNAQGFEAFGRELLARAHEANEQMNAFSGELDRDERACRHARQAARVAEHLQRRVMATASWVSLDPHGKRTEGLHDLACTLYADQLLALEWREGIVRGESGLSEAERREHLEVLTRILAARSQLHRGVEVLRLLLFEHEMDVQARDADDQQGVGAARAVLRQLGW